MATDGTPTPSDLYLHDPQGGCYFLGEFHPDCTISVAYPWVWCSTCRVLSHVDVVSRRIRAEASLLVRPVVGVTP